MTRDINVRPDPIGRVLVSQGELCPSTRGSDDISHEETNLLDPFGQLSEKCIKKRPFIQQFEIQWATPQNTKATLQFEKFQTELDKIKPRFYKVTLKLESLFRNPESASALLLHGFLTNRFISALSYGTRIDCDDVIAITPEDGLVLNVTKETYQTLGLVGTELKIRGKPIGRYLITLDLPSLVTSKSKLADRARWCFSNTYCHNITFLMAFTDPVSGEDIEAESLLNTLAPGAFKSYSVKLDTHKASDVDLPSYESNHNSPTFLASPYSASLGDLCTEESVLELMEWSGAISCGILGTHEKSVTFLDQNTPYIKGQVIRVTWRGFLTPVHTSLIFGLWSKAVVDFHANFQTHDNIDSVGALISWGFEDTPISWRQKLISNAPHTFHLSGENVSFVFASPSWQNIPFILINAACPEDFAMG